MRSGFKLLTALLLGSFSMISAVQADVPKDFSLSVTSEPSEQFELELRRQTVSVDSSGKVTLRPYRAASIDHPLDSLELSAADLQSLYDLTQEKDFFGLQETYADYRIAGGDLVIVEITADGKSHSVISINRKVTDLDDIVRALNELLPEGRKIRYNALVVDEYSEVKR